MEKTVIILGAGASCGYGFPSGNRLLTNIVYNRPKHLFTVNQQSPYLNFGSQDKLYS